MDTIKPFNFGIFSVGDSIIYSFFFTKGKKTFVKSNGVNICNPDIKTTNYPHGELSPAAHLIGECHAVHQSAMRWTRIVLTEKKLKTWNPNL